MCEVHLIATYPATWTSTLEISIQAGSSKCSLAIQPRRYMFLAHPFLDGCGLSLNRLHYKWTTTEWMFAVFRRILRWKWSREGMECHPNKARRPKETALCIMNCLLIQYTCQIRHDAAKLSFTPAVWRTRQSLHRITPKLQLLCDGEPYEPAATRRLWSVG
nr:hypothetical protein CFP56_24275 [Quercus suber]